MRGTACQSRDGKTARIAIAIEHALKLQAARVICKLFTAVALV